MERKVAREFRHKVGFETATVWLNYVSIVLFALLVIISLVILLSLPRNGEGARILHFYAIKYY